MSFRDDREAAHRRADALQAELDQLRLETAGDPRRPGPTPRFVWVVGAGAVAALVGAGALVVMSWSREAATSARAEAEAALNEHRQRQQQQELDAARRAMIARADAEARAERLRRQGVAVEPGSPVVAAQWPAVVDEATGIDLAPGTTCRVLGVFTRVGVRAHAQQVTVECGDRTIYQSTDDGDATGATVGLREGPVFAAQSHRYLLSYADEGERPGARPRATISTTRHEALLWREGTDAMRVTLFVRDVSDPHEGSPLRLSTSRAARQPAFADVIERTARVTSVRGHAPVARGGRCSFAVRAVWEYPESCRVAIRCGRTWLYGAGESGYLTCEVRDGHPVAALDENTTDHGGDPRVTWRGPRVTVSDFTEAGEWAVDLSL